MKPSSKLEHRQHEGASGGSRDVGEGVLSAQPVCVVWRLRLRHVPPYDTPSLLIDVAQLLAPIIVVIGSAAAGKGVLGPGTQENGERVEDGEAVGDAVAEGRGAV